MMKGSSKSLSAISYIQMMSHTAAVNIGLFFGVTGRIVTTSSACTSPSRWFAPTANLEEVDPRCGELDYLMGSPRRFDCEHFMSNNFAFGGINTSLVFRRI